jgi:transposase
MDKKAFVGLDVHKDSISISIAEKGRNDPVRFLGAISNSAEAVAKMAKRLSKHGQLDFCYEAAGAVGTASTANSQALVTSAQWPPHH